MYLGSGKSERPSITLHIGLNLCWDGFGDAVRVLFNLAESSQYAIPLEVVSDINESHDLGDLGIALSWNGLEPDVILFVRNNIVVSLQGHRANRFLLPLALSIDNDVKVLDQVDKYHEEVEGVFSDIKGKMGELIRIRTRSELPFGTLPSTETHFFMTSSGSVNRDPKNHDNWYYGAGLETGKQEIVHLWVGSGILLKKERLVIEIVEEGGDCDLKRLSSIMM